MIPKQIKAARQDTSGHWYPEPSADQPGTLAEQFLSVGLSLYRARDEFPTAQRDVKNRQKRLTEGQQ